MKVTTEQKKGIICLALAAGLTWLIVYLVKRDKKKEEDAKDTHIITEESISVAVNAFKSGMEAGETKENLDEINTQLKQEFGVSVEYRPLQNKYVVRDLDGKKVQEV